MRLYPQHLILGFELFGDALTEGHLFYQLKKHSLRLLVQISQITVQLAGDLQLCVQRLAVLSEIPQVPLAPNADGVLFFVWHSQAREIIVFVKLVPQPSLFVVDLLFHRLALPFIITASLALPPFCLLCFSRLCDQMIDLPVPEHPPKESIVFVLLPQSGVFLFEPVIACYQMFVLPI